MKAFLDSYTIITILSDEKVMDSVEFEGKKYTPELLEGDMVYKYQVELEENTIHIPKEYFIFINGKSIPMMYRGIVKTDTFNKEYAPIHSNLGSIVTHNRTTFRLFAPTATFAYVVIEGIPYKMSLAHHGIYELNIEENLAGKSYIYKTRVNHQNMIFTDPYAKASLPNRRKSVVVDFYNLELTKTKFTPTQDPTILEMSVRDFTMDPKVPFTHRGKLLGLLESHHDYGMQHILDMGINYIQLMPVSDFETVDELDVERLYNWGYDVMQFMSLEGSYSSNVQEPTQVIKDLSKVVNTYHNHNIGVIMDVVFNHVYEVEDSPLHQSVPYYYFRYDADFNLTDGSFCGNEIATEMPMARKIIVDSCVYFVDKLGMDGFRFDLMGLMDIETINQVDEKTRAINPNVLIYGEGWDMEDIYPIELRACMKNHKAMPNVKHFNDDYRDRVGGKTDASDKGITMLKSKPEYLVDFLNGKSKPFSDATYSINYVECHDNYTVKDKMDLVGGDLDNIRLMNAIVALSKGTPFFHIGQSFGRDKQGDENSYKSSDSINRIPWSLLDENKEMHEETKQWLRLREEVLSKEWQVTSNEVFINLEEGKLSFSYKEGMLDKVELQK